MSRVNERNFWEDLYRRRGDQWELHRPTPALIDWLGARALLPPSALVGDGASAAARADGRPAAARERVAVPGCGRGHDARLLAHAGFDVTAFDFADDAIREARALAAEEESAVRFEQRDIFSLPQDFTNAFDGVWEYTCFCAIDPARRPEYVKTMAAIVKPGGWFLACFYPVRRGGSGPPFPVAKREVRELLSPSFRIERDFAPRSVPRRLGQEWMVFARRT